MAKDDWNYHGVEADNPEWYRTEEVCVAVIKLSKYWLHKWWHRRYEQIGTIDDWAQMILEYWLAVAGPRYQSGRAKPRSYVTRTILWRLGDAQRGKWPSQSMHRLCNAEGYDPMGVEYRDNRAPSHVAVEMHLSGCPWQEQPALLDDRGRTDAQARALEAMRLEPRLALALEGVTCLEEAERQGVSKQAVQQRRAAGRRWVRAEAGLDEATYQHLDFNRRRGIGRQPLPNQSH